jgi:hypothetical protein
MKAGRFLDLQEKWLKLILFEIFEFFISILNYFEVFILFWNFGIFSFLRVFYFDENFMFSN